MSAGRLILIVCLLFALVALGLPLLAYVRALSALPADLRAVEQVGATRTAAIESAIDRAVNPK